MYPIEEVVPHLAKPLPDTFFYDVIPPNVRHQIRYVIEDCFKKRIKQVRSAFAFSEPECEPFEFIRQSALAEFGLPRLCSSTQMQGNRRPTVDYCDFLIEFLPNQLDVYLYVVGFTFQYATGTDLSYKPAIENANRHFRRAGIGYEFNIDSKQILRVDNNITHAEAIQPALALLADKRFATPNQEFMDTLDHYKAGNNWECVTGCCKSFESVMKIVCQAKNWPFNQNDTAAPLLKTIITQGQLPTFFEQPLLLIATMRNRSGAHGGGAKPVDPIPDYLARYCVNATASAILMLVEATRF